jgi:hypothetical protein
MGHNYKTYDIALDAHIYLCDECEPTAIKEMNELLPRRKKISTIVAIIALAMSLLSMFVVKALSFIISDILQAFIAALIITGILWTFVSSTRISRDQFELSGPRRFFFDWTVNGPIRFTNETLVTAFKAANPNVRVKKVRSVGRGALEKPDGTDCLVGCCCSVVISFAGLWLWMTFVGIPLT